MGKRQYTEIIVQQAIVEFVRNSITDGVPSEDSIGRAVKAALDDYEGDDPMLNGGNTPVRGARIVGVTTTVRKVPIEAQG